MTSTTSAFSPAATRAGTADYSADTSTALTASDSSETRSFEELCPEDRGRRETELLESPAEVAEDTSAADDAAVPTDATAEVSSCDGSTDGTEGHDEREKGNGEAAPSADLPALLAPSIIQTLLSSLREIVPQGTAGTSEGDSAENAASANSPRAGEVAVRADGRVRSAGASEVAATVAVVARQTRSARGVNGQIQEGDTSKRQPAAAASPRATDKDAAAAPSPVSAVAKAKATPPDETAHQPVISRLLNAKGHAEKSAGQAVATPVAQNASGLKEFLPTGSQDVANVMRPAGTRTALSAGTMSSSTTTAQRHSESPVLATASQVATGQGNGTETLSVDWKGWTNGGGERASTAAQFSQLGDKVGHLGIAATPATAAVARAATSAVPQAAPAAPTVPADAAEALAPIHSAIERLVLHGREQLALTVRFEQGGSLSIKLAMQQGEIATQIQTDVPGLEAALKSAWGELAQDWNSRGWKLAQPEFSSSAATYHPREDTTADGRDAGRRAREQADDAPSFGSRTFSPARLKHAGAVTLSGLDALRAAAMARRGIHTWA